ncbi:MAG: hypothetical protein KGQ59_12250, partial [Bdellovibrionales bacterium]|nr:hypothetical protein [Bdellovibrionales bacterium]
YAIPEARIVDLLDPSFLYQHDRPLHEAREAIKKGEIVDIQGYLQDSFQADYLLTRNPALALKLDEDPLFERVFPKKDSRYSGSERLFQLRLSSRGKMVTRFEDIRAAGAIPVGEFSELSPTSSRLQPVRASSETKTVYFDLSKLISVERKKDFYEASSLMRCVSLRPNPSESQKWVGRNLVAVGGGKNVRIWLNEKPFYHSVVMPASAQLVSQVMDVGRPMRPTDKLQLLVCSRESSSVFGLSLSFWTDQELSDLCQRKQWKAPETLQDERAWQRQGSRRLSCLGSFAI